MTDDLKIRIPAELKRWLRERAEANSRTMNGEILALLKAANQIDVAKRNGKSR